MNAEKNLCVAYFQYVWDNYSFRVVMEIMENSGDKKFDLSSKRRRFNGFKGTLSFVCCVIEFEIILAAPDN